MAFGIDGIVRRIEWLEKQLQRIRGWVDDLQDRLGELQLAVANTRPNEDPNVTRRQFWARASTPIGPPSGTNGVQMTSGTVRIWVADDSGLRADSGLDVTAYNGYAGETVPANAWIVVERNNVWEIRNWDCG